MECQIKVCLSTSSKEMKEKIAFVWVCKEATSYTNDSLNPHTSLADTLRVRSLASTQVLFSLDRRRFLQKEETAA